MYLMDYHLEEEEVLIWPCLPRIISHLLIPIRISYFGAFMPPNTTFPRCFPFLDRMKREGVFFLFHLSLIHVSSSLNQKDISKKDDLIDNSDQGEAHCQGRRTGRS
jgi:hypothetical protein